MISQDDLRRYEPKPLESHRGWTYDTEWHHGYYEVISTVPSVSFAYGQETGKNALTIIECDVLKQKVDPFTRVKTFVINQEGLTYSNDVCRELGLAEYLGMSLDVFQTGMPSSCKVYEDDDGATCIVDEGNVVIDLYFVSLAESAFLTCVSMTIYDVENFSTNCVEESFEREMLVKPLVL